MSFKPGFESENDLRNEVREALECWYDGIRFDKRPNLVKQYTNSKLRVYVHFDVEESESEYLSIVLDAAVYGHPAVTDIRPDFDFCFGGGENDQIERSMLIGIAEFSQDVEGVFVKLVRIERYCRAGIASRYRQRPRVLLLSRFLLFSSIPSAELY